MNGHETDEERRPMETTPTVDEPDLDEPSGTRQLPPAEGAVEVNEDDDWQPLPIPGGDGA